jgi:stage II sporulation protein D
MNILTALVPLLFLLPPGFRRDDVRIGLFTLFKPEVVEIRVAAGEGADLTAAGVARIVSIRRGETIAIRLSGNRLYIRLAAGESLVATETRISPVGSATLELRLPGKIKRTVCGELIVDTGSGGRGPLRIVLKTDREAAVASVVAAETSERKTEALKALAVVVRTFMVAHAGRHSVEGYDFCDTTHCQFYRGEQALLETGASSEIEKAVEATRREVLTFAGRTVEGYYTATCGGMTVTPSMLWGGSTSYPYRRVSCRWCRGSRFDKWERSAGIGKVLGALSEFLGSSVSLSTELITDHGGAGGFVRSVTVADAMTRKTLTADAFRRAIGLKLGWNTVLSPTFTIERRGQRFIFRGRGFGSQIGLCEAGAIAQAAAGRSYRDILCFYYPGAETIESPSHE